MFTAKEVAGQGAGPSGTGRGHGHTPGAGLREEPMGSEGRGLVEAGPGEAGCVEGRVRSRGGPGS